MSLVTWEGRGSSSAVALYERNANPSYSPVFSLRGHKAAINHVSLYSPPPELRQSPPQRNSVSFSNEETDSVGGMFASSLATSCDAGGEVWVWDLDLRRALFSFRPIEAAQHIKKRRIAKEVNAHVDRLEREKGTPLSPQELASAISLKMSEIRDDDLRPSSSTAMSGVLSASILVVRSEVSFESTSSGGEEEGREYDDDEGDNGLMTLPILVTQCRNQKVYFWLVRELDPCEEEEITVNDFNVNVDSTLSQTNSGPTSRKSQREGEFMVSPLITVCLVHEVRVPQLGFCPSLQWVCENVRNDSNKKRKKKSGAEKDKGSVRADKLAGSPPTTLDELYAKATHEKEDNSSENDDFDNEDDEEDDNEDHTAASFPQSQSQSICVASPCDNNGAYSFQRFSISVAIREEEEETVEVRVESSSLLTIADFKCGQAMTATLFADVEAKKAKKGPVRKLLYLTVGYESGHVVVVDVSLATSSVFRTLASPRVFPDPITACCGVRRVPEGLIVVVGSAEGMLRSVSIPIGLNATKKNIKVTESSPFGQSLMAVTGGHQGWSHRAQHGLGSVTVDCVKNSPHNSLVLVAGWDGQVRLLRAHSGEVVTNLVHHKGSVACVAVASDKDETSLFLAEGGRGCGESNGGCSHKRFAFSLTSNLQGLAGMKGPHATHTYAFATAGVDQEIAVWAVHSYS